MRLSFKNKNDERVATDANYNGKLSREVADLYRDKIALIVAASDERDFRNNKGLGLEKCTKDFKGSWAIRINKKYRIVFDILKGSEGNTIHIIYVGDYH